MSVRPAPGAQLGAGRLRVDAAKAIAKLREYQLVDRTAWVLEAIRAAVASDATAIELRGDSNDVWLSWAGTPWPAADLPRLLDELVSPEPGAARHHIRLLAAAVNSALGANPAHIDVYAIGEAGSVRARYTPDVLETPEDLEESALSHVRAEPCPTPPGAAPGMLVHYRRRTSLEVLSYWLRTADPPELVIARSACTDIATPIRIGARVYTRAADERDLLRVPLGRDLEGFLAVTEDALHRDVVMAIAERGVLLETTTVDLGLGELAAPIPLRLLVDGDRMPTNASRSEVRRDAHPIEPASRRARTLLRDVVARLVAILEANPAEPRARAAAIRLVAAIAYGTDWGARTTELPEVLRPLGALPLLRDATGVARPITWPWLPFVHVGKDPHPPELVRWLSQLLWVAPGDPSAALVPAVGDTRALRRHVRWAMAEYRAEKKFYKHALRPPRVAGRRKPRVRARIGAPLPDSCIPDTVFDGLAGEVCVYRDARRDSELKILFDGREIETVQFDSPTAFDAVIDSARVSPVDRFRGVARDAEYARVERAMRGGIVRAIEAIALTAAGRPVAEYHVATEAEPELDARLVRDAILLARNLGATVSAPFDGAPIWRVVGGDRVSLDELRRHAVIGVVPPHAEVLAMTSRVIVYAGETDRALLGGLLPVPVVAYEPAHLAHTPDPSDLALHIIGSSPHALAFRDDELAAAIVPSDEPRLHVFHRGALLAELAYKPSLAPCTIAIDSDAVVPDATWKALADDAGLATRDYTSFERRLAREVTRAVLGEPSLELIGADRVELGGRLGRWLCLSLVLAPDPAEVLGAELVTRLRTCSLFRVLGGARRASMDELAAMFPRTILYIEDGTTEPVPGVSAVVADNQVALAIGKLVGRGVRDAGPELERRRLALARDLRLGEHRAKSPQPISVPGVHVALDNPLAHGVVGIGRDVFELEVLVEGRPFQTIVRPAELPLAAVVEVDLVHTDARFERLNQSTLDALVAAVTACVPALVQAMAEADPRTLADAGPQRALLSTWLVHHEPSDELRGLLARTIQFPTLHGPRATIAEARRGSTIVTASWRGEWLAPDGDLNPGLDRAILHVPEDAAEVHAIVAALANLLDVTPEVEKLQAQRRMKRGLLPVPTVPGAVRELTRSLGELGNIGRHLGPGEITLVSGPSEVLLHVHGELRRRVRIETVPSVHLAIEAPELVDDAGLAETRVGTEARELATLLVRQVLGTVRVEALPAEIRRGIRSAILSGRLLDAGTLPVFETLRGTWIDLAAVHAQRALFGDIWYVPAPPGPDALPLDERRIVLVLSPSHTSLAHPHELPLVDATSELLLDARLRQNRARPRAESLAIADAGVLARVELEGDGVTAARGTVAVLAPAAAHHRGWHLHRDLHPFDPSPDLCRWPTRAIVDDARLAPDRTWSSAQQDEVLKELVVRVQRAGTEALHKIAPAPASALVAIRVAPWTYEGVPLLERDRNVQVRGTLWLAGPPVPLWTPSIEIIGATGASKFTPLRGTGVTGTLYVYAPDGWKQEETLEQLSAKLHERLVRDLCLTRRRDPDLVAAHAAWALALRRITIEDAKDLTFHCFQPAPLEATQLAKLLDARDAVTVIRTGTHYDGAALVDDGSETARVILDWLGTRARPPVTARRRPDTLPPIDVQIPPAVTHPLQAFVDRVKARIGALGVEVPLWRIVDRRHDPIVHYDDGVLVLAGDNRHVVTLAAAVAANSPWAAPAIDALAAHCMTVLNIALTQVTDATEAGALARLLR